MRHILLLVAVLAAAPVSLASPPPETSAGGLLAADLLGPTDALHVGSPGTGDGSAGTPPLTDGRSTGPSDARSRPPLHLDTTRHRAYLTHRRDAGQRLVRARAGRLSAPSTAPPALS